MITYEHRSEVHVLSLLLGNYLVIDVGVWSGDALFASSPEWRTVRARAPQAATAIADAMAHNPRLLRTRAPVVTGDDPNWQSVYVRFIARKRSDADNDGVPDEPDPAADGSDGRDPYPERGYRKVQARFLRVLEAVP